MRNIEVLIMLMFLTSASWGQNFIVKKMMVFGQVAAGGGYETLLTLTNRGTTTFSGTMTLLTGQGEYWNPMVNGVPVVNGALDVTLLPGTTQSLSITSPGVVAAGVVFFVPKDLAQTDFLEGTLTYFVKAGPTLVDSIGVIPSTEFYVAALPFDDFGTIGLALANLRNTTTNVTLSLFFASGPQAASISVPLGPAWHTAKFLSEIFSGLTMGRGRIEIRSEVPIYGTALTLIGEEVSSLPLVPTLTSYTFAAQSTGVSASGTLSLWVEDSFVKGFVQFTQMNGAPITPEAYWVYGQLLQGTLTVMVYGGGSVFQGQPVCLLIPVNSFSFSTSSYSGPFLWTFVGPGQSSDPPQQGVFSITRLT